MTNLTTTITRVLDADAKATKGPWEMSGRYILRGNERIAECTGISSDLIATYRHDCPALARACRVMMEALVQMPCDSGYCPMTTPLGAVADANPCTRCAALTTAEKEMQ